MICFSLLTFVIFNFFCISFGLANQTPNQYLAFSLYSGLTNQLFSFYHSSLLAHYMNWTLVLPSWNLDFNSFHNSDHLPFEYFLIPTNNTKESFLENHPFSYVSQLPQEYKDPCINQLSIISFETSKQPDHQLMKAYMQKHHVVCLNAETAYYKAQTISKHLYHTKTLLTLPLINHFRTSFQISPTLLAIKDYILQQLERKYQTQQYISFHARNENDFEYACKHWSRSPYEEVFPKEMILKNNSDREMSLLRSCLVPDNFMYQQLIQDNIPNNTLIMLMSEKTEQIKSLKYLCGHICSTLNPVSSEYKQYCLIRYRCTYKEEVWDLTHLQQTFPSFLFHWGTSKAMIDFTLSLNSTRFYGNFYSTLSRELLSRHVAKHSFAQFYNPTCNYIQSTLKETKCP